MMIPDGIQRPVGIRIGSTVRRAGCAWVEHRREEVPVRIAIVAGPDAGHLLPSVAVGVALAAR
jgi:hypothetical protein